MSMPNTVKDIVDDAREQTAGNILVTYNVTSRSAPLKFLRIDNLIDTNKTAKNNKNKLLNSQIAKLGKEQSPLKKASV